MIDYLFDTNIVIYLLAGEKMYVDFLESLGEKIVGTSVVTVMEVLFGLDAEESSGALRKMQEEFEILPVDTDIAVHTAIVLRAAKKGSARNPWLVDAVIAQTAQVHQVPLVTNNPKDFSMFCGLDLVVP